MDLFFRCRVSDVPSEMKPMDDVSDLFFIKREIHPADFGLVSIRKGIEKILADI